MNVTELARKLKIPTAELRDLIPQLGFDIGKKAIKVDDKVAQKIIEKIKENPQIVKMFLTKKEEEKEEEPETITKEEGVIKLPSKIVVRDFAAILGKPIAIILQELMKNGILVNLNEQIDFETAAIIAEDFGFKAKLREKEDLPLVSQKIEELLVEKNKKNLKPRPPVVVVMGHVDHGKTKLLDAIRKTHVMEQEAGGITQSIGAYQVTKKNKLITFIDTPGHEAFTAMRSRGARAADLAILVVAADDGIKPQTLEAIKIIESAKLPFVVAINKIDKPEADVDKVKHQLSQHNLVPEEWGGKTICVPISAKTGQGIDSLLETLLLVAEMEKDEIKANPNKEAVGTIIESHLDKGEGPVATVLIQAGTLSNGDFIQVGTVAGKIRLMKDYTGKTINQAAPSTPVRILGLKDTPQVGEILQVKKDVKSLKKIIKEQHRQTKIYRQRMSSQMKPSKEDEEAEKKINKLNIVLKTDNLGSYEAISESLGKIQLEGLKINIVKKGLGNVTEADVMSAESSQALIYGFNVIAPPQVQEITTEKQVEIRIYKIIYELIEDVNKELEKLLSPEIIRVIIGRVKVLVIFRTERKSMIVGGLVTKGKAENNTKATMLRDDAEIGAGKIVQLQQAKKDVETSPSGSECGLKIEGPPIIQVGDFLEFYKEEKKYRKLV